MVARLFLYFFLCLLMTACGVGPVTTRHYQDVELSHMHYYVWRGAGYIDAGSGKALNPQLVDEIEHFLDKLLGERGLQQAAPGKADIEISYQLRLQNASEVEQQYLKKPGVFKDITGGATDDSNVLLSDVNPPLFMGQQRGGITLIIRDAGSGQPLRQGKATVIFPDDPADQKQLSHLKASLRRLVNDLFE